MEISHPRKQKIPAGVSALATETWNLFYDMITFAVESGFALKDNAPGAVTLKHPGSCAEILLRIDVLPEKREE